MYMLKDLFIVNSDLKYVSFYEAAASSTLRIYLDSLGLSA